MRDETPSDPQVLALTALAVTLGNPLLSRRFLDLTGIGTDELRSRAGDPLLLAALLGFLEANEADLVAVAADMGVDPAELVGARRALEREEQQ